MERRKPLPLHNDVYMFSFVLSTLLSCLSDPRYCTTGLNCVNSPWHFYMNSIFTFKYSSQYHITRSLPFAPKVPFNLTKERLNENILLMCEVKFGGHCSHFQCQQEEPRDNPNNPVKPVVDRMYTCGGSLFPVSPYIVELPLYFPIFSQICHVCPISKDISSDK